MRLLRSGRRRKTASAASAIAAINNAPPITSARLRAGLEASGGSVSAFVGGVELDGEMGMIFAVVTGGKLAGGDELVVIVGAAFA